MAPEQYGVADTSRTSLTQSLWLFWQIYQAQFSKKTDSAETQGGASRKPPLYSQAAHPAFICFSLCSINSGCNLITKTMLILVLEKMKCVYSYNKH